jgi:hypothetical protein
MKKANHPLKARMFVGGLKSMLIDVIANVEDIEKSGTVPRDFIQGLTDVKHAIDLTLKEFKNVTLRCCEHGEHSHSECDEECHEHDIEQDEDEEEEQLYCETCDEYDCVCDEEEEEEAPPPPPPPPPPVRKPRAGLGNGERTGKKAKR